MRQNLRLDGLGETPEEVMWAHANKVNSEQLYEAVCKKEMPKCYLSVGEIYFAIFNEEIIRVKVLKIKYDPYMYIDTGGFGVWSIFQGLADENIRVGYTVYPPGKLIFLI